MSDEHYFGEQSALTRLRTWAFGQMVWGAFIAAAGLVIVGVILLVILGVSHLLPEQSKQAPSPYTSMIFAPLVTDIV